MLHNAEIPIPGISCYSPEHLPPDSQPKQCVCGKPYSGTGAYCPACRKARRAAHWATHVRSLSLYEQRRASAILRAQEAVQRGIIRRQTCQFWLADGQQCGSHSARIQHVDYRKPLEVLWLCSQHSSQFKTTVDGKPSGMTYRVHKPLKNMTLVERGRWRAEQAQNRLRRKAALKELQKS